ncbi:hypothetical protein JAAARDRAFT_537468 [Jaapia argillacea MUCL 33604]|uniref:Uncharacterized protein n=1 Tax=Jaapia argillacea MUCL 33604 TaxID=933084 RepID=A0A067PBR6_9AGAM|nr:hypothetical protein JAAARDRAFT_537468 [Jaapia argillacea MUCL 33604]
MDNHQRPSDSPSNFLLEGAKTTSIDCQSETYAGTPLCSPPFQRPLQSLRSNLQCHNVSRTPEACPIRRGPYLPVANVHPTSWDTGYKVSMPTSFGFGWSFHPFFACAQGIHPRPHMVNPILGVGSTDVVYFVLIVAPETSSRLRSANTSQRNILDLRRVHAVRQGHEPRSQRYCTTLLFVTGTG